ncbi:hypothetical protein VSH64_39380 [Amycolatopsis rhabdoformis]|uniref:LLM class flavin-dependent oxidoreductase n=1 Tax=Amycolatopsis rhabdoformis TaxID=1448059 RepID=A0ABZ1I4Q0_9PSEU|nr:hypothetical protein [Amycolatopsis rhabdoformis]WSE28833.1 hypothetical protein VSH64_39380 [Amycolatopsis rhabdoformis]
MWTGQPVGGGADPGVPAGTREVPMPFGGGDPDLGRANVRGYYAGNGGFTELVVSGVAGTAEAARAVVASLADLGVSELIFNPGTDDVDDVKRLADAVL